MPIRRRTPIIATRWGARHRAQLRIPTPTVREACDVVGRDPVTLELTAGVFVSFPESGKSDDGKSITGTDEEIAAQLQAFADVGVTHLITIIRPFTTVATIERFARVVEMMDRG